MPSEAVTVTYTAMLFTIFVALDCSCTKALSCREETELSYELKASESNLLVSPVCLHVTTNWIPLHVPHAYVLSFYCLRVTIIVLYRPLIIISIIINIHLWKAFISI